MNESKLAYLFQAYFNKTATQQERDELMQLMQDAENDEKLKSLLAETWLHFDGKSAIITDVQFEEMLANILQKEASGKIDPVVISFKRKFKWLRFAAAAAVLLFAILGVSLWLNHTGIAKQSIAHIKKDPANHNDKIVPGGNKAMLTLSDGSKILLDSTHQGTLTKQGNVKIMKLNTATLAYNAENGDSQKVVYNTLSTPSGGQYELILQDGTKVWLNASSSIYFPTIFKGQERNVTITGEAYFEVAKNATMPFKINVKDMEVQVLGTHFNIMAYEDENTMNTTLLEGSVKVSKGASDKMLLPGEQSRLNKTGDIKVVKADTEEVMAWKNGWFQFNAYDIEEVMRQISRWYNVEVVYEGKIPSGHFSGIVSRGNDISQVLKIMESGGVRFKIEGRKVIVLS
ncbi:MAG: FecR domain-containing protein [Bacteroidota bacterium]|nr:FecR domain-containing protein [Bacteroidota bacterium]